MRAVRSLVRGDENGRPKRSFVRRSIVGAATRSTNLRHQFIGDALTTPFLSNIDPLQLTVAIESSRSMSCNEPNQFTFI
jgi:hypothetical protein